VIYDFPMNADFRRLRPRPESTRPGDLIYIPVSDAMQKALTTVQEFTLDEFDQCTPAEEIVRLLPKNFDPTDADVTSAAKATPFLKDYFTDEAPDAAQDLITSVEMKTIVTSMRKGAKLPQAISRASKFSKIFATKELMASFAGAMKTFGVKLVMAISVKDTVDTSLSVTIAEKLADLLVDRLLKTAAAGLCGLEFPACALWFNGATSMKDALTIVGETVEKTSNSDHVPAPRILAFGGHTAVGPEGMGQKLSAAVASGSAPLVRARYDEIVDYYRELASKGYLPGSQFRQALDGLDSMFAQIYQFLYTTNELVV
jgi:hypothetical protein